VSYDVALCDEDGSLLVDSITPLLRKETKVVIMLHASNVCGTVMPVETVAEICKQNNIKLIVDAAQTAGVLDIDASFIDAFAFTGHKGLLGPQGIGGFIIKKDFADEIAPLILGGTGSRSHEFEQPDMLPDKFESGTMNIPAILGLKKAVEFIVKTGTMQIFEKEMKLTSAFISSLQGVSGVNVIGRKNVMDRVAVVSLDFPNRDNATIAAALDEHFGVMIRCGLHCAPAAHKTLKTYPHGTVRFSFGYFNTMEDVEYSVQAIRELVGS